LTPLTALKLIIAAQIDALGRNADIALYRIRPEMIDGRKTVT
jgi:hypothetical protein